MSALKVLSLRLRGMKGQLEELGEETDENVENISKMQGQILNMTKGKVNIFDASGNFRSTYEIMQGIAQVWDELSSIDQANLLETIAGKNRANDVAALLSNWQKVEAAVKSANEAEGSAARENAKYVDSLQGRLDKLTTAWQSFANAFMNSDFLKGGVSALTDFVEILEKIVKTFGSFGTVGLGVSIFGFIKNFGTLKTLGKDVFTALTTNAMDSYDAFKKWSKASDGVVSGGKKLASSMSAVAGGIGLTVAAIGIAIGIYKKHREEISKTRQEVIQASDEFLNAAGSFEQAYIKYSGKTNLTVEEEAELESAINGTVDALGDKSSALQNVVNSSNDYVASLEAITDAELKAAEKAAQEKQKNAKLELEDATKDWYSDNTARFQIKNDSTALKIAKEMDTDFLQKETKGKKGHHVSTYWFDMPSNADADKILDYYYTLVEYKNKLLEVDDFDTNKDIQSAYEDVNASIEKLSETVKVYEDGLYDLAKAEYQARNGIPKTTEAYLEMREAILTREDIAKTSLDTRLSILNSLDSEYANIFDLSSAEAQARKFVGIIKGFGDGTKDGIDEIGTVETFLNMRTALNNNECTVSEYLSELDNITSMAEKFSDEEQKQFKLAFGLDTDSIKEQYEHVKNYVSRSYLDNLDTTGMTGFERNEYKDNEKRRIGEILDNLTASELAAVVKIKGEIDWQNTSTDDILAQIKEEAKFLEAMNYTIAIDVETESLDALNSALSESVSGAGLTSDSIAALKGRYAELASQGYDLSKMFEETSNGIHLNKEAVSEFEHALASQKLSETDGKLDILKNRYDELTKEINNCTDAGERAHLYSEQQEVAQKINDLATLASQYKGLTSAYNAWQNAESAGNERDMYENIISGFETIEDEISRGWYDDGTIKFLELMTGQTDLAGKSASELKEIWNSLDDTIKGTSYSVKDFFTTDEDGNSTSTGAYNFLRAVEELGKNGGLKALEGKNINELVERNSEGKIVAFDFDVVGGDEAVAKALGVSEEMVQIIQRTLDDAGFVVTLDGKYTLLADLKISAEEANDSLKKLQSEGLKNLKDLDLNFDFNVDTVEGYQEQLEKALNVLDKFRNKDGTLQTDKNGNLVEGAKNALEIAEYYTAAMDKLTEPKFMQIDTSTVDEELQEPIEKMQEIGDLCKEKHLVSLTGDTKELDKVQGEIDKVAKEIEKLEPEVKAKIGIDEDWDAKTIADKIEKGEIEVPAELKLDVQMSEDLKDMRLLMMRQLGLVSEEEVKLKVGYEIDESTVDNLTPDEQKVVVEFITENEDWFDKLTNDEKKVAIELVASGVDLDSLTNDEEKEVVVEFVTKNEDIWNKLSDEEKQTVVKYVAKHDEVDKYEPEDKEALVRLIVNKDNVDNWKPEDIDAVVKYCADDEQVKKWSPEEKKAYAKYLVDGGEVDDWSPEAKDAFVKYLVDGGDPDKFDPDDKESWVVYKKDSSVPDSYEPKDPDATVTYNKDSSIPDGYNPPDPVGTVTFEKDSRAVDGYNPPDIFRTVWYTIKETVQKVASGGASKAAQRSGASPGGVNGTANPNGSSFAYGTIGKSYRQGDWRTKKTQTALTGELGREIVVTPQNQWYTVGDNGAEFVNIPRGSIIFNHRQTEELLKNGKATSDGGRAKAFVNGTAFVQGTAYGSGSGGGEESTVRSITVGTNKNTGKSYTKSADDSAKDFEETFDLIEIAIDRVERAIDQLDTKANSVYRSWSERNSNLTSEISKVRSEINLQQRAYQEYLSAANAVGLSSSWVNKIKNGQIDITTVKDEALAEKIKDYEDLYNKALDAKDAILELQETESKLYAQRVENVATQYESILGVVEHEKNMLEEYISQSEAQGWLVSAKYYDALASNEKDNIAQLQKEKAAMLKELQTAMQSGTIAKGSEAYYEMVNSIDEVTLAITESETALKEYQQTIQQLSWKTFDLLQDKISSVTEEAEFLIELMSSDKLFDDKGKLTDEGSATLGLHGQNYNSYMYQADKAAAEAERLKKELAKDPYDTELEERYREMVALQQEYILSAQNEKESIRDLIDEGYSAQLDSLQELIDKKNEALESERDLYEYQKKVKEQTQEISALEKQMAAYAGDDSEEARQKVQQIKVDLEAARQDLEETETDRLIESTATLLDELYLEAETLLNARLDNLDALVEQVIAEINTDSSIIGDTIREKADSVGYELSNSLNTIWSDTANGTNSVITNYGEKFLSANTTTNNTLSTINTNLQNVITQLNSIAKTNVKSASTSSASNSKQANASTSNQTSSTANKNTTSTATKSFAVGGKINAKGAQIYDYAGDTSGERQLYRDDPIYKILQTSGSWLQVRWHKLSSGITGWFKKGDVKAYATGKRNIQEDQMAWTQEKGREFIVRPSDGAILTPVAKSDDILNATASGNIWNMANNPSEFIKDNLKLDASSVPNTSNVNNSITQHFENVVFSMPNVHGYNDLLKEMQSDPKFEKLILSMTIDQIAGRSKLAKGKSIR